MNVAILTPIEVEHRAILAQLPYKQEKLMDGNRYLTGEFKGRHHSFQVITQRSGSKNETLALAAERIIRNFQPAVVILAGVAGGIKDVRLGDVVVGTKYYGYEAGKVAEQGFATRPDAGYYSSELLALAQSVAANGHWRKRANNHQPSKVEFGPIAGGNKVVASTDSDTYRLLRERYNDAVALEMEAAGFGEALRAYPSVRFLNVRGISDLLDDKAKSDANGSQELAADNMAAFVFELLWQLDMTGFNVVGSLTARELCREIVELVSKQGNNAAPTGPMSSLVQALQPYIAEEIAALKANPEDADAKADAKSELRRALEGKSQLHQELAMLLEQAKALGGGTSASIQHSHDVVQGNSISAGHNVNFGGSHHSGDNYSIVNNYYLHHEAQATVPLEAFNGLKRELQQLIARGRTDEVLAKLIKLNGQSNAFSNAAIQLSGRLAQLRQQEMMGVLGFSEGNVERSRINNAVLSLLSELPGEA